MHIAKLALQHNSAVEDEYDARHQYVAHLLFRKLAAEKRLTPDLSELCDGFRLLSEDFRPVNVLDEDLRGVGVIDWELTGTAPAQFSFDPPWWLLLGEVEN